MIMFMIEGAGGLTVANQIFDRFRSAGKALNPKDIAILDAAEFHYYQVRVMCFVSHLLSLIRFTAWMVCVNGYSTP